MTPLHEEFDYDGIRTDVGDLVRVGLDEELYDDLWEYFLSIGRMGVLQELRTPWYYFGHEVYLESLKRWQGWRL